MKRKDINPLFIQYKSCTSDMIDVTKATRVAIYSASGTSQLEKGLPLYEFDYEPIFEEDVYLKLLNYFDKSPVLVKLYRLMSFNYFNIFSFCIEWYTQKSNVKGAFSLKELIENYESKINSDFSCPVIKYLDLSMLDNNDFYGNLDSLIRLSEWKRISSVNVLLYGKENPQIKDTPTREGKLLINSVINIAYKRFLNFLLSQEKQGKNNFAGNPTCLKDIFPNEESKINIILEAIRDLNISKLLGEREITGFIDGCKMANALPNINTTDLLKVIYFEIGKKIQINTKPRYDRKNYDSFKNSTQKYFNIK